MAGVRSLASHGPLPLEQLLRSSGSEGPLAADSAALLDLLAAGPPAVWSTSPFTARVEAARRHLAPVTDLAVLEASFEREASNRGMAARSAPTWLTSIRVAYAIRWQEIAFGLQLPPWQHWIERCTACR